MYRFLLLLFLSTSLYGQSNKYALIIQNRKFDQWDSFLRLENNSTAVKGLLIAQGFEENNITIKDNITAVQFREAFESFIRKVPSGAICVVFLGSHGHQIADINGDEKGHNDFDGKDEVFICTDSPKHNQWSGNTNKYTFDYNSLAITDDELGDFNNKLLKKITPNGHYLLLADFCFSLNSERNEGTIKTTDGGVFTDYSNAKESGVFVVISASNKEINVIETPTSYFVNALEKAFTSFTFSTPTYLALGQEITNYLSTVKTVGNINQLVFQGDWNTLSVQYGGKIMSTIATFIKKKIGIRGEDNQYIVNVDYVKNLQIGVFLDLYLYGVFISEGKIVAIDKNSREVVIEWAKHFEPITTQHYQIQQNQRFQQCINTLEKITNKNEIGKILALLPVPKFNGIAKVRINEYDIINEEKIPKNKPCESIEYFNKLDLKDKITLCIDTTGIDKKLYYTYLDINSEGVNPCFIDSNGDVLGFISIQEPFIYRSQVTKPLGDASYLILLTDSQMSREQMMSLVGNILPNNQKNELWNILTHIKGYRIINYQIVQSRKR